MAVAAALARFVSSRLRREIDSKGGSVAGFAVDVNETAMLFDYPVHCGKAKPGPLAEVLRGKEGCENAFRSGTIHSDSCVVHSQKYVLSRWGVQGHSGIVVCKFNNASL